MTDTQHIKDKKSILAENLLKNIKRRKNAKNHNGQKKKNEKKT
jgi:hypothetical protein